jgi:hypothetical protein
LLVAPFFIAKPFCMALFHRMVASNLAMRSTGLAVRALVLAVRAKAFKRELRICRARVHAYSLALFSVAGIVRLFVYPFLFRAGLDAKKFAK